jgi:peroxiredoxin Q/BCP
MQASDSATNFSLLDQNGKPHSLTDYIGKWVVLYFYPKDDTPGCTKEACNFRDSSHELQKLSIVILGVSKDTVKSHKKFTDKYTLNFPLLSDESLETIKAYGAWGPKKFMGREYEGIYRMTYLINPEGRIVKIYEKVNPLIHAREIIDDLKSLEL